MSPFFHTIVKKVVYGGLAILTFLFLVGLFVPMIKEYLLHKEQEELEKKIYEIEERTERAYRNDSEGGKTPEETFDLFLAALKKGDIEQASKYYEFRIQKKALEELKEELKEKGNLTLSIEYFSDARSGEKKCHDLEKSYGGCYFEYIYTTDKDETSTATISRENITIVIPKGTKQEKSTSFKFNPHTKVWKIFDYSY